MSPQSNNGTSPVRRIVLTGAPGTGKSTVVQALEALGYSVMKEVSREYWEETGYGEGGNDPWRNLIAFSKAIWTLRAEQHRAANWLSGSVFYDRSLLDILAYMDAGEKEIPAEMNRICFPTIRRSSFSPHGRKFIRWMKADGSPSAPAMRSINHWSKPTRLPAIDSSKCRQEAFKIVSTLC